MNAIAELARPVSPKEDELFSGLYTPRRVGFWLAHYPELEGMAHWPSNGASLLEPLTREWVLLQERPRSVVCLCQQMNDGRPTRAEYGAGGSFGPANVSSCATLADLHAAADALPVHWKATEAIYRQQGLEQYGRWQFRYSVYQCGARTRHADTLIEPPASPLLVLDMMAYFLGWRSEAYTPL